MILLVQCVILFALALALVAWLVRFPNPSPVVRRWLPARKRWPEAQVRGWLRNGRFQRAFLKYFYRDPERVSPARPGIVAPADGLVTSADVREGVRYLVIALSFWDMHVQRSPLAGEVTAIDSRGDVFTDGEGRQFAFLREKRCPVQKRLMMRTALGELGVRLITSVAARRIELWVEPGERLERGQRIGRILLGSTVVLELPPELSLSVRIGERVRAGESLITAVPS